MKDNVLDEDEECNEDVRWRVLDRVELEDTDSSSDIEDADDSNVGRDGEKVDIEICGSTGDEAVDRMGMSGSEFCGTGLASGSERRRRGLRLDDWMVWCVEGGALDGPSPNILLLYHTRR